MEHLIDILTDEPIERPHDVFRRSDAAHELARLGRSAHAAVPALRRTLVISVSVDCAVILRVAVAEALWKVGGPYDIALPFLAWALKDEKWGASRRAVRVLGEMGATAHQAVPELVEFAERRYSHGPFKFEKMERLSPSEVEETSLLFDAVCALGRCGRGPDWRRAHAMLIRLTNCEEEAVRTTAVTAMAQLSSLKI